MNHVRALRGWDALDPRTVRGFVGDGAAALVARAVGPLSEEALAEAVAAFMDHYDAHCLDATRLYPGMREVLDALASSGRSLSVLTNKPYALADRILIGLGVRSVFVDVVGGDSLPTRKPDPAGLRHVATRAGVTIARTTLVGDSPVDLDTALAAGGAFCGVAWGFAPERLRARRPARLVRDPRDLVRVLDGRAV